MTHWVPVGYTWLGHRPEPFIHERAWACPLTGSGPCKAEIDAHGRGLALRHDDGSEERPVVEPGRIVIKGIVETFLDGDGRPVRSVYPGGAEELYRYDDAGRVVEIDEPAGLYRPGARDNDAGRLTLTYDDQGLLAIRGENELVWERCEEPWPSLLVRGAAEIADMIVSDIEFALEEPGPEIVLLALLYVAGSGVNPFISLRGPDVREDEWSFWYPEGEEDPIQGEGIPWERERVLLREAGMNDPDEAERTILTEVARLLVNRDWGGLIRPSDDFVAFIAEHDEDFPPKYESLRAINPPDRAALWLQRFPSEFPG